MNAKNPTKNELQPAQAFTQCSENERFDLADLFIDYRNNILQIARNSDMEGLSY